MSAEPLGQPQPGASDAELLRAIAAGSEAAFAELRGRYGAAVTRVCRAVGGREAEDCEQDGIYEFFFCGPPLIITGGTGSPINPQAIK